MHTSAVRLVLHSIRQVGFAGIVSVIGAGVGLAQQSSSPVVFDKVTVIDVEHGNRLAAQRVVVTGNRISAMGPSDQVNTPAGAKVIDASGKYLIPALWDMHVHHPGDTTAAAATQQVFVANGVLGFRDAGTTLPLPTATGWQRDVLAGTRIGPTRQFFSGQSLADPQEFGFAPCVRADLAESPQTCVADVADALHVVDSLAAAGARLIKVRSINSGELYYAIVREAHRLGLPVGGHIQHGMPVTARSAADSGVSFIDHMNASANIGITPDYDSDCLRNTFANDGSWDSGPATVEHCRSVADYLAARNTWFVPTVVVHAVTGMDEAPRMKAVVTRTVEHSADLWADSTPTVTALNVGGSNWLRGAENKDTAGLPSPDSIGKLSIVQKAGLPVLAGTDTYTQFPILPGFMLQAELSLLVVEGMTPLAALQAGTLNPAKALRLTDSLGTVAQGKLADLVLLDADPLADISNTTTIRAVMANGRYFDRAALDRMLLASHAIPKP